MFFPMTLCLVVLLSGCAAPPTHLQRIAEEGIQLRKQIDFGSSPEVKLKTAQELIAHAVKYDQLMNRSTDLAYLVQAHRFQREEREAALTLMREAAADYTTGKETARARTTYQLVVTTFWEEDQWAIRESAESSLAQLNRLEKGPQ